MDNFNYPMGADNSSAPWNQNDNDEREFDINVIQTLSKATTVHTDDYIEGEVDWESECDEEGNRITVAVPGEPDTSNTNWKEAFNNEHYSALDLIQELKRTKTEEIKMCEIALEEACSDFEKCRLKKHIKQAQHWVDECEGWEEDELEIEEN